MASLKRRVGHFLSYYPMPASISTVIRGLSRAMVPFGWESIVYCCPGDGQPEVQEESEGVTVLRFSQSGWNPFRVDRRLLNRLARNEDEIDLLLIHGIFHPPCVAVAQAAKKGGVPFVVCPHGTYHPVLLRKNRWRKLIYGLLYERPLLNAASAVQVFFNSDKVFLSAYGIHNRVVVLPNGFDPGEVPDRRPAARDQEASRERGPCLLYLGKLRAYVKGLDVLLEAFSAGIRDGFLPPDARLDLVGPDYGDQHELESLAVRLGVAHSVRFPGGVAPAERWNVVSSHDILVLPSRWDGFGLPVLEAMTASKPVVVSEDAGVSSIVREAQCGYVVQPTASSVCAGLVSAVRARDEWERMGDRGRAFAYEHLTWGKVAERASLCYEELLRDIKGPQESEQSASACASPGRQRQSPVSQA